MTPGEGLLSEAQHFAGARRAELDMMECAMARRQLSIAQRLDYAERMYQLRQRSEAVEWIENAHGAASKAVMAAMHADPNVARPLMSMARNRFLANDLLPRERNWREQDLDERVEEERMA